MSGLPGFISYFCNDFTHYMNSCVLGRTTTVLFVYESTNILRASHKFSQKAILV